MAADSSKSSGFDTAPGLNASIAATGSGTYTVTFQQGEEQWGFNQYGSFLLDSDKNGNGTQYSYGSNGDLNTIIDTQGRTITLTQGTDATNNLHQVTSYTSLGLSTKKTSATRPPTNMCVVAAVCLIASGPLYNSIFFQMKLRNVDKNIRF